MDYFLESMTTHDKKPGHPRGGQPRPSPTSRNFPPPDQPQKRNFQQGGNFQGQRQPSQRPSPPPIDPKYNRVPPPPPAQYQSTRQQNYRYEQQQQNPQNYQRGQGQRGRPYQQRNFKGPSPPAEQHQQFNQGRARYDQYQSQPERDQNNQRGFQRNQEPSQYRRQDYQKDDRSQRVENFNKGYNENRYESREDHQSYPNRRGRFQQDRRQPQQHQQYQQEHQPQQQRRQPRTQQDRQVYREKPKSDFRGQQTGQRRGAERGRYQGPSRGRGRPNFNPRDQKKEQKPEVSEESVSMEEEEEESEPMNEESASEEVAESQEYESVSNQAIDEDDAEMEESEEEGDRSRSYSESENIQRNMPEISDEEDGMQRIDTMVSKEEYTERVQTFKMNNRGKDALKLDTGRSFAIFQVNKKTFQPDIALTLKRFRRSTNRGQDDDDKDQTSDHPRSKKGLSITMKHILKQIIDSDGMKAKDLAFPIPPGQKKIQFLQIYDFLWNRMREMIKDVSRLDEKDRGSQDVVIICQQMLRFFIIAIREGRLPHNCKLEFDSKMNLESITKILTQLLEIYEMAHYKAQNQSNSPAYISPNQPQIMSYAIIISHDLQKTLNEKLRIRLDGEGLRHPLVNSKQIQTALLIKKAIRNRDFQTFYTILQSKQTDYVQACLLVHSLPSVRRQTLKVLQKTAEPDPATKSKKIPSSILKRVLRYSPNFQSEFYSLLENIGARVIVDKGEQVVLLSNLNESLADYQQSFVFDFGYSKTSRANYPNSKPKQYMIDAQSISREELIKRSWNEDWYVKQCHQFYKSGEEQHFQPTPKKKVESDPVPQTSESKKETSLNNMRVLMEKKKQLVRNKFLKNLEGLIQTLVRRSDVHSQHQRKRGIAMLQQQFKIQKLIKLKQAFLRIYQFSVSKKLIYDTLESMSQFAKNKVKFMNAFYKGTSELSNYKSGVTYNKLSNIVEVKKRQYQNVSVQLERVFKMNQQSKKIKILVFFISSNQYELNHLQIKFIKNFYKYMAADQTSLRTSLERQIQDLCHLTTEQPFIQIKRKSTSEQNTFDYQLKFYHYKLENHKPPFLCGYNSILYLDLHDDNQKFIKMLKEMTDNRYKAMNQVLGFCPALKTNITNLVVCNSFKFKQKMMVSKTNKEEVDTRWYYLEIQSNKLSLNFRHSVMENLLSQAVNIEEKAWDYEVFPLKSLVSQIYQNMLFAQGLHQNPSSVDFFEMYFKANLKYLIQTIKKIAQNYELIDWTKTILDAAYLTPKQSGQYVDMEPPPNLDKINLNNLVAKKLISTFEILSLLKNINITKESEQLHMAKSYFTTPQIIAETVEKYLQQFSMQQRQDSLQAICQYVIENNCELKLSEGKLKGDATALVSYIFSQLKKELQFIDIILPKGFRFKLKKSDFIQKQLPPQRKNSPLHQGLSFVDDAIKEKPKMKYQYEDLLNKLIQELKQEETESTIKNLQHHSQAHKKIKT